MSDRIFITFLSPTGAASAAPVFFSAGPAHKMFYPLKFYFRWSYKKIEGPTRDRTDSSQPGAKRPWMPVAPDHPGRGMGSPANV